VCPAATESKTSDDGHSRPASDYIIDPSGFGLPSCRQNPFFDSQAQSTFSSYIGRKETP